MPELLTPIVVSACLGALIGLIRQWGDQRERETTEFAGLRTHALWAVLGCVAGFTGGREEPYVLIVAMLGVAAHLILPFPRAPGTTRADRA